MYLPIPFEPKLFIIAPSLSLVLPLILKISWITRVLLIHDLNISPNPRTISARLFAAFNFSRSSRSRLNRSFRLMQLRRELLRSRSVSFGAISQYLFAGHRWASSPLPVRILSRVWLRPMICESSGWAFGRMVAVGLFSSATMAL